MAIKLDSDDEKRYTFCGTPFFMAPEMIARQEGYSYEVDLWAVGVIIYTLLVGKTPFESESKEKAFSKIRLRDFKFPKKMVVSDEA